MKEKANFFPMSKLIAVLLIVVLVAFTVVFFAGTSGITGNFILRGVEITYIIDSNCSECYDAKIHSQILTNNYLKIGKETFVESNSDKGKELIELYSIESLPTYILPPKASKNEKLMKHWSEIGTIEKDGNLVFRNNYILGTTYLILENGRWVSVSP